MTSKSEVRAFRDPGRAFGLVVTDEPSIDDARASGRWIAIANPERVRQ